MLAEESSTSAISLGRLEDLAEETEEGDTPVELKTLPIATKKRKRKAYKSPGRLTEKVKGDISNMLKSVPKIDELFTVLDKIGEGTFSTVYRAVLKQNPDSDQEFALKYIIPTSHPDRILSELSCLVRIGGCQNVMGVKLTVREKDNIVIVMPYFRHCRFQDFYHDMSVEEVQDYLRNLCLALKRVHKFNVIHRDVKPGNFLYDRNAKKYALVDFGLAQAVPTRSKGKLATKTTTVGGVLHHDTPRPADRRKNTRRTASASENKPPPRSDLKRTQSESRSTVPRLAELDPNTFLHSTEKSSRDRSAHRLNSAKDDDLKKNGSVLIPQGSENTLEGSKDNKAQKSVILLRRCSTVTTRGIKKVQESATTTMAAQGMCSCFGLPQVCDVCMGRKNQVAPRAGTPGFRSPEVLLKCPDQTTAVDMWAAGVIFLSILSGRYPFFRAPDDVTALAQIMSIMGTEETKEAAEANGKNLQCSVKLPAMDLKTMCQQLRLGAVQHKQKTKHRRSNGDASKRRRRSNGHTTPPKEGETGDKSDFGSPESQKSEGSVRSEGNGDDQFPDSAYDLLKRLLELDPKKRITAAEALQHPFLSEIL